MACGGSDATESSAENDAEQIEAEVTGQTENADTEEEEVLPEGKYRSELTNELIDESLKDQRPIAVMVDNESIALPHYGLSHADDGIPFRSQYHVRRSDAADTSNLIHTLIILKQRHKSCNASVQRTVHHLIYHICM